jgi:hypothetical protein
MNELAEGIIVYRYIIAYLLLAKAEGVTVPTIVQGVLLMLK